MKPSLPDVEAAVFVIDVCPFGFELVAASDLADLEALGFSGRNKMKQRVKQAPGNAPELHSILHTVANGKGGWKPSF